MDEPKPKRKYTRKNKPYLNSPSTELTTVNEFELVVKHLKKEDGLHTTSVINSSTLLEKLKSPTLIVLKKNKLQKNTYESIVTAYWTRDGKCIGSFDFKGFCWGYKSPDAKDLAAFIFNSGINIKPEVIYSLANNKLPFVLER